MTLPLKRLLKQKTLPITALIIELGGEVGNAFDSFAF